MAPGELDLERFREHAEWSRRTFGGEAATTLSQALGVWRGPPLADFAYEPFAQAVTAQLEELHLAAVEDRVEAELALGHARETVGELRHLVARHPLLEQPTGQLMLALYRSGTQSEALEAYQDFGRMLSEELGLEPGPVTQQLELTILKRDPTLDLAVAAGRAPPPVASHGRVETSARFILAGAGQLLAEPCFSRLPSLARLDFLLDALLDETVHAGSESRPCVSATS